MSEDTLTNDSPQELNPLDSSPPEEGVGGGEDESKKSLAGIGVLIVRPPPDGEPLARAVEEAGGEAIIRPAMLIESVVTAELRDFADSSDSYNWVIFVSANAARICLGYLRENEKPNAFRAAAVGEMTAAAIVEFGMESVVPADPAGGHEPLLAMDEFKNLRDSRVAVICADGGSPRLRDSLLRMGAAVSEIPCYRRVRPPSDHGALRRLHRAGKLRAVAIHSAETLDNLIAMTAPRNDWLRQLPLVAIHPQIAMVARARGFSTIIAAAGGRDKLIAALIKFFSAQR